MGQPHWSDLENDVFFGYILPQSHYANGYHDPKNGGSSFHELAKIMQQEMALRGEPKRRKYDKDNMFQHFYQRYSKRAVERGEGDVVTMGKKPEPRPATSQYAAPSQAAARPGTKKRAYNAGEDEEDSGDEHDNDREDEVDVRKMSDRERRDHQAAHGKGKTVVPPPAKRERATRRKAAVANTRSLEPVRKETRKKIIAPKLRKHSNLHDAFNGDGSHTNSSSILSADLVDKFDKEIEIDLSLSREDLDDESGRKKRYSTVELLGEPDTSLQVRDLIVHQHLICLVLQLALAVVLMVWTIVAFCKSASMPFNLPARHLRGV